MFTFLKSQNRTISAARALVFSLLLVAGEPSARAQDVVDHILDGEGNWLSLLEQLESLPVSTIESHHRFEELMQLLKERSRNRTPRIRSRYLVARAFLGDSEIDLVDEVLALARTVNPTGVQPYAVYAVHHNGVLLPLFAAGQLPAWRNRRHRKSASLGQFDAIDRLMEQPMKSLSADPAFPYAILFAFASSHPASLNSKTHTRLSHFAAEVARKLGGTKSDLGRQAGNLANHFTAQAQATAVDEPKPTSWEWEFINQAVSPGRRDWRMLLEVTSTLASDWVEGSRTYYDNPMGANAAALVWPSAMQAVLRKQLVGLDSGNPQFVRSCQELLSNDGLRFDFHAWRQKYQLY